MALPGWRGLVATLTWPSMAALSKSALPTMARISPVPGRSATRAALLRSNWGCSSATRAATRSCATVCMGRSSVVVMLQPLRRSDRLAQQRLGLSASTILDEVRRGHGDGGRDRG